MGRRRQGFETRPDVIVDDAHVLELFVIDMGKQAGDAVQEGLSSQDRDIRVMGCLPGQMFAATKTDFQPQAITPGLWTFQIDGTVISDDRP